MPSKAVLQPSPTPNCISRNIESFPDIQKIILQRTYQFKLVLPVGLRKKYKKMKIKIIPTSTNFNAQFHF